ncbi:trihelix transcription factor ASR3-like [Cucurbita maxima]|uniref:Trihelix transcription factor ASR3-like n=1 Tax=Cucurbita maxima TaxID=3661 RepID=A0A6J1JGY9_CUCMA|nr:trihelix transcription factor ASR3-like [Cucurbita maxima]
MSEPPTTSTEPPQQHQHQHQHEQQKHPHHLLHLPLIHCGASTGTTARINAAAATSPSTVIVREYRKGNWSLQETMILITAKKLDEERRNKAEQGTARKGSELRWKWVENYCWSQGCQRSQNQCNDKWDNLLRDYKKVREHESRACDQSQIPSYWKMEKHERKDNNLPSNMAFEVYQALNDVVQRKLRGVSVAVVAGPPPPPSPTEGEAAAGTSSPAASESSSSSGREWGQKKEKRERKRRRVGRSIERSASAVAQTLRTCEEQREIRHQQLMEIKKQRLQIQEARNHIQGQGIADLVAAVANLSGINNRSRRRRSEEYECLYSGEEVRRLKEQNEAMQAELSSVKTELSQLRDQMPSLVRTVMHNVMHNIPPPPSMDPGGDAYK